MPSRIVTGAALAGLLMWPYLGWTAFDEDFEAKRWEEVAFQLPDAPKVENLVPFYVSPGTANQFFVDLPSVSVTDDGVVRYTLVVISSSGAKNISFEGMRCETRERRLYAFGRTDGSWGKSRVNQWEVIREAVINRHHAALYQDYFCRDGVIVRNAATAKALLRGRGATETSAIPRGA